MGYVHASNLSKVRQIRLGVACRRVEVLNAAAAKLCADRSFNSYDEAISHTDTIAVVIATPPDTHPDLIEKAAKAGKHIFSEKPLGFDSQSIRSSIAHVEKAGVRFMTGFMRRWDSAYVSARKAVDKGDIGYPIVLKCTSGDPEYPEKYHRGGAKHSMLKDLAVHDIDLARWLTKSEVKRVYAVTDALSYETLKDYQDSDVAICVLEMENRAKIMIHLSRALWYGYNVTSELMCRNGSLRIGALKQVDIEQMKDGKTCQTIAWDFRDRFAEAFDNEMKAFAELVCAASDTEAAEMVKQNSSYATCLDGLRATAVAEALVRSSESGVPEKVL
ncbi:Oxidoreductase [Gracilaria domingensis]|nr:Oxidoreductase [Gracilaria domingensis]